MELSGTFPHLGGTELKWNGLLSKLELVMKLVTILCLWNGT